jgi:deoxyribodipyrimidine photo-lyase
MLEDKSIDMDIVWHRQDLRIADNIALYESTEALPVYIFDKKLIKMSSPRRLEWVIRNVKNLRSRYRDKNSDLLVRTGKPHKVLSKLCNDFDIEKVLWNKSYSKIGRNRDDKVADELENVETQSFHDKGMHEPEEIFTNKGDPYSVFTYYHKKWKKRDKTPQRPDPRAEELHHFTSSNDIPEITDFGFEEPELDFPRPGTEEARERLDDFIKGKIDQYDDRRDYPSDKNTSRLSPYLSYGVIGVREVWEATQEAKSESSANLESIESFQEQLAWRDFYTQVLYHNPEVVTENYKDYENPINWSENEEHLEKWKKGETGYPIVDAGMRQMLEEGRMHNRLRMIVASFLTKDLMIDWREGYHWFRDMLIDHDTANNNGGWQWAASTGTDAQPYFRIFNPMTQGERYDEDAEYIKKYVPELRGVDSDKIHSWNNLDDETRDSLAPEYYHPVVDHSEMRDKAIKMFEDARGD